MDFLELWDSIAGEMSFWQWIAFLVTAGMFSYFFMRLDMKCNAFVCSKVFMLMVTVICDGVIYIFVRYNMTFTGNLNIGRRR
jgi:hypothetical protein